VLRKAVDNGIENKKALHRARGARADRLLVDGDPLQDVAMLQQGRRLKVIKKDGVFWKSPASAMVRTRG